MKVRCLVAVMLVAVATLLLPPALRAGAPPKAPAAGSPAGAVKDTSARLPRLVDLGADRCIPCKKMAPILVALRKDYAGAVDVVFLDVWKDPRVADPYRIRLIPTQIFFDRTGRERFRHEGFFPREEIEKIFRDSLGVAIRPAAT